MIDTNNKEQLVKNLAELRQRIAELEASEAILQQSQHDMAGSTNCLRCLYDIANITGAPGAYTV